jgi:hypothetical protein
VFGALGPSLSAAVGTQIRRHDGEEASKLDEKQRAVEAVDLDRWLREGKGQSCEHPLGDMDVERGWMFDHAAKTPRSSQRSARPVLA